MEWETLKAIIKIWTPAFFPEEKNVAEDYELFKWASSFVQSRALAWGVPHLTLAPLIDGFNHVDIS